MSGQTIILYGPHSRQQAKRLIDLAPSGAVLNVREARRTTDQNSLLWALVSQISRAKPDGRVLAPEIWKSLFMAEVGFEFQYEPSLDGNSVVPVGFKSSRLTKGQFSDLIESIFQFAAERGIPLGTDAATDHQRGA